MPKKFYPRRRCQFCVRQTAHIDYRDIATIREFTSFFGRIQPRYYTGNCIFHQKMLARAIKNARHLAIIPFVGK